MLVPFTALFPNFVIAEDAIFDSVAFAGLLSYFLLIPVAVAVITLFFNALTIGRKGEEAVT